MWSIPKIQHYSLFLIWLLHSAIILLLAYINPNHYTTIDSHYYLESAANLLSGKGYTVVKNNLHHWNSTFPIGYSLTILIVSLLTETHILIASKLVNIAASGIWLIYLSYWFGREKSIMLSCILFFGSFLKLWAHTWSEPLFLIILFCWTYQFYALNKNPDFSKKSFSCFAFLGFMLISVRYAGIFIVPTTLAVGADFLRKKNLSKAKFSGCLGLTWTAFFAFYLWINKYKSGTWSGGERFDGKVDLVKNLTAFSKGILNELLIRDINFEVFTPTSIIETGIQIVVISFVIIQNRQKIKESSFLAIHFWLVAIRYLLFLFTARLFSSFDEPAYRLLSPFSFLALCGFCLTFDINKFSKCVKFGLITLIIFSWLDLIPRHGIKIKLSKALSAITDFI